MSVSTRIAPKAARLSGRAAVISVTIAVGVNLALYGIGRAAGGTFSYVQSGNRNSVVALGVSIMSAGPLIAGLGLLALLLPRWPGLIRSARFVVWLLALGTIALLTVPAHFDTTGTVFLSCMHLALIPISLLAIAARHADDRQQPRGTG